MALCVSYALDQRAQLCVLTVLGLALEFSLADKRVRLPRKGLANDF